MSEWREVIRERSNDGFCRERWVLVIDRHPDGSPAAWVSAMRRVESLYGCVTFWETALATPRTEPKRWASDDTDFLIVSGADRRAECVGKTREELVEMFRNWSKC